MSHVSMLLYYHSDVTGDETAETVLALPVDATKGFYRIDGIPFYAPGLACGDVVQATPDKPGAPLVFRRLLSASGHSTIQVFVMDDVNDAAILRELFQDLGCATASTGSGYFVMDVPVHVDYVPVKKQLDDYMLGGILDYAEPCISNRHQY
ncbi:DUF4265 domain-containing protein [Chitinophaga rhizosphaerae]|uniref:DUF4265 domain-containing protein n=1 Tax=Chitinophaga rhizosphaerae TaxID=1864947 RepID=UPI0013DF7BB9|nr:DUF4265 domain-containing protein [Chitinophaga rhizosphaerae]